MTRMAFLFEVLGFGLVAALVAWVVYSLRGQAAVEMPSWLSVYAGVAAAAVWSALVRREGRVRLSVAALAGVLSVVAAHVLGTVVITLAGAIDRGPEFVGLGTGLLLFALLALVLTAHQTLPPAIAAALAFALASRLWRRRL
ncbi:hypothetical protein [Zavarzinia compransoris]|uniref:Uncharacterized protein n=1 Tax=Zavarzinia compransoris TaxID=1264899 RepID=A0A317E323_9PROT|nr:hypothetical protein [Zavarzinia compransoris]PWR20834.1 hypothetical protein DKG75_12645 [Zavarzinia compransoris]TDP44331.1 hypothetical protein DES42_10796 [Zavarzinia compransoris]